MALSNTHQRSATNGQGTRYLNSVTAVGLDLAKHVFQIYAVDAVADRGGQVVKAQGRAAFFDALPPCVIGLEACGSAHHWARELIKHRS